MRQINHSGYMHNRLRMIVASFLTKDLGIDWRRARLCAEHLNDFDLAANNGGWQWAASTGCDAQPWFRIFNPVTQSEKFDPDGAFIRRLPELAKVPDKYIHAPWTLPPIDQKLAGCVIGRITRRRSWTTPRRGSAPGALRVVKAAAAQRRAGDQHGALGT
jgi:deoxyribodipyrimidine photo-lyase